MDDKETISHKIKNYQNVKEIINGLHLISCNRVQQCISENGNNYRLCCMRAQEMDPSEAKARKR